MAASLVFLHSLAVRGTLVNCHWAARLLLQNVGIISHAGRPPSLIPDILAYVVKVRTGYSWDKLFGSASAAAERLAIMAKQRFETDIDAFVVSLDSFCDLVTKQVFFHRGYVMKTTYGNAIKAGAPKWLRSDFPQLIGNFARLHDLRIQSLTAHPRHIKTGALNKRITRRQYDRLRRGLVVAFEELARVLPL